MYWCYILLVQIRVRKNTSSYKIRKIRFFVLRALEYNLRQGARTGSGQRTIIHHRGKRRSTKTIMRSFTFVCVGPLFSRSPVASR